MKSHGAEIFALLLLLSFFVHVVQLGSSSSDDFLECLTNEFQSTNSATEVIYTPQNNASAYAYLLQAENLRPESTFRIKPQLIVTPYHESEIIAAIHCSKKLGLQIRVKSGGHDYEGLSHVSLQNPFLIIDMRNFRQVQIDTEEKTAWVQVGATLGQLYYTIAQHSKTLAFPAGVCPTVGVGGHLSGGGYGMISRKHSIAADNIIDAKLINAYGETLDRKSMGEDLFWAIRGGGGTSFGIILAFKVNLVIVPETVTVFNVSRTTEENSRELVHKWQYVADKVDERLFIRLFIAGTKSPVTQNKTVVVSFTTLFLGGAHDLLPIMQEKFPELGLTVKDCSEMSWIDSVLFLAGLEDQAFDVFLSRGPWAQGYYKGKSDFVRNPIPLEGLRWIWSFLNDNNMAQLEFSPYGGALSTSSESKTPFPHRAGNIFMIHYLVVWGATEEVEVEAAKQMKWLRRLYSRMGRYVSKNPRSAYLNYRDLDLGMNNGGNTSYEQASVWGLKYFGKNFDRLVRVKTAADPMNFFRNEQSIPPLLNNGFHNEMDAHYE